MSSLWTPGGEHEVPREAADDARGRPGAGQSDDTPPLDAEQEARLAQAAEEVSRIRAELAAAPAELVVANHAMGLYELAAIHLGAERPDLGSAQLAIDAFGAILGACRGRLGEAEATLEAARGQIQLAYVGVARASSEGAEGGDGPPASGPDPGEGEG